MAGFLAVLGGAMSGLGSGLVENARAKREAAIEAMKEARADARAKAEREFTAGQNQNAIDARAKESALDREARTKEAAADRASLAERSGTLVTGEDGSTYSQLGSTVTPVKTPDGKDFRTKPTKKDSVEFDIEKAVEDAVKTELGDAYSERTPAAVEAARERNRYRIRKQMGMDAAPPAAPRDAEHRVIGQVYSAPDGRSVKWTGQGWQVVSQ